MNTLEEPIFERYLENLKDVKEIILPDDSIKPNWLAIPLQCDYRLELLTYLEKQIFKQE